MTNDSRTAEKIKAQIIKFANKLSQGSSKPQRKFIHEIIFGIQASKDIKLSNISRALKEDIRLIKTENRLSHQLSHPGLRTKVRPALQKLAAQHIKKDTVLALDLSDIRKDYAKKMEYLTKVYDGSTGQKASPGYWLCSVVAAEVKGEELIPLYQELFSQDADDFKSENEEIIKALDEIRGAVGEKGIWTLDRGGDREELYRPFMKRQAKFVIRAASQRNIICNGRERNIMSAARTCSCPIEMQIKIDREGYEEKKKVYLGVRKVKFTFRSTQEIRLIVVKGFGLEPLMLLTNLEDKSPEEILEIYLTRWKIEESFRFIKQSYNLEDIRVQSYNSLRNLVVLVLGVFYFVCVELGKKLRLNILLRKIYRKAKRFFGIPSFKHYAIADGVYALLFASLNGLGNLIQKCPKPPELTIPLFSSL